ncbi:MAG: NAD(P)H-dependent oxidoreductase subunit E, partial [Candidatus Omnitrophica bacterium]|nr:NAD(P)H-dependent oxidoreductase subunit E [Candidatus Omnitrophota bacterium]
MKKSCSVNKAITKDGKKVIVCDQSRAQLLPVLQKIQKEKGCISEDDMQNIAEDFNIHPVEVFSVVSFYAFLTSDKKGKNIFQVSTCAPCECAGSKKIIEALEKELGIKSGQTTADGSFSIEATSCIGMCDQSPAMIVNGKLIGNVTVDMVKKIIGECKKNAGTFTGEYKIQKGKRTGKVIFSDIEAYAGLRKAIEIGRSSVLEEVRDSGIKGRGGAGFPVGVKWNLAASAQAAQKYVVCNADEGE